MLPEVEVEDESIMEQEEMSLMKSSEVTGKVYEQWDQLEKENRTVAGAVGESGMARLGGSSPATGRGMRRTDTEEECK